MEAAFFGTALPWQLLVPTCSNFFVAFQVWIDDLTCLVGSCDVLLSDLADAPCLDVLLIPDPNPMANGHLTFAQVLFVDWQDNDASEDFRPLWRCKMHELCHALPQCHRNSTATLGTSGTLTAPDFSGRHLQGEPWAMPWVLWVQLPV